MRERTEWGTTRYKKLQCQMLLGNMTRLKLVLRQLIVNIQQSESTHCTTQKIKADLNIVKYMLTYVL